MRINGNQLSPTQNLIADGGQASTMNAVASTYVAQTPSAVNTTFTFTGLGAAEAQLYDYNDTTGAADARALQTDTRAAYDFGSAKDIRRIRAITDVTYGFGAAAVFNLEHSDTNLTTGFTTFGTISIEAGTSKLTVQDFASQGAHRYWRIYYLSGTVGTNAWFGDLDMFTYE